MANRSVFVLGPAWESLRCALGRWLSGGRRWLALALSVACLVLLGSVAWGQENSSTGGLNPRPMPLSNYELAQAQPFNRVEHYPITPLPTSPLLRPNGAWLGRLMLPSEADYAADPGDWAWFEVWHGADPALVGQVVKLTWRPGEENTRYVQAVTTDIAFTPGAERFWESGNIVPIRLNGRKQVGPMQSLAGARPNDDVTVRLVEPELVQENGQPVLQTTLEPIQITGREYGLVKLLEPDLSVNATLPTECPGPAPCPTEFFRVQFYDPATQDFTGPIGTVRIPQQPMARSERFFSNIRDILDSPAGREGWYIYGARDDTGMFTVQSLKPRALFQLQPDQVVLGRDPGLKYINRGNWRDTPQRKGTLQRVLVSPNAGSSDAARAQWQEGDYGLLVHLFGGIGGENSEFAPLGTVTGHFSYGLTRVVREPITNELQFSVQYQQVYAHNGGGIVSGTHDWADYTGDMQRGWLGIRPLSDIVVKLDSFITPFQFGDVTVSLFRELLIQTQVMMARYRTGDGTGFSGVTPATSCVQDSNQALFIAMAEIRRQIEQNPQIVDWVRQNPNSPVARRALEFVALGEDLEALLTPYGVIRPDWQRNADTLAGIDPEGNFSNNRGLFSGALSWQSMMPRWGHDAVARVFLRHGGQLWFLRTNMVGGDDPRIVPISPTGLMGGIPVVGTVAQRLADSFVTWPHPDTILVSLLGLVLYGAVALPFGRRSGFLMGKNAMQSPLYTLLAGVKLWFVPCLVEELIFRVAMLPHPMEGVPGWRWLLWTVLSVTLFVLYHVVLGNTLYREAKDTLQDRRFLTLVGWLGLLLAGLYWMTGSLWLVVWVHWAVVVVWIFTLGGFDRMPRLGRHAPKPDPALPSAEVLP